MQNYSWPGNVRQLENICRRVMVMGSTHEIDVDDLPNEVKVEPDADDGRSLGGSWEGVLHLRASEHLEKTEFTPLLPDFSTRFESVLMRVALTKTAGRRHEAARLLGWGRNTLTRKIKEYDLDY